MKQQKTFSEYAIELTPEQILNIERKRILIDYEMHVDFIRGIATEMLKRRGFLTLSEVLYRIGLDPTREKDLLCGWVYRPDDKNHNGDNFVDIRYEVLDNGNVMLDFNVDGNILDYFKD